MKLWSSIKVGSIYYKIRKISDLCLETKDISDFKNVEGDICEFIDILYEGGGGLRTVNKIFLVKDKKWNIIILFDPNTNQFYETNSVNCSGFFTFARKNNLPKNIEDYVLDTIISNANKLEDKRQSLLDNIYKEKYGMVRRREE